MSPTAVIVCPNRGLGIALGTSSHVPCVVEYLHSSPENGAAGALLLPSNPNAPPCRNSTSPTAAIAWKIRALGIAGVSISSHVPCVVENFHSSSDNPAPAHAHKHASVSD